MAEFMAVARVEEFGDGTARSFVIAGEELAVVHCNGEFYAISNICSHAYTHLSEGEVDTDECQIECPLHGARFDLSSGKVRALPATVPIKTFPVRIVEGQIEVAVAS